MYLLQSKRLELLGQVDSQRSKQRHTYQNECRQTKNTTGLFIVPGQDNGHFITKRSGNGDKTRNRHDHRKVAHVIRRVQARNKRRRHHGDELRQTSTADQRQDIFIE